MDSSLWVPIVLAAMFGSAITVAAHRFARRREKEGAWNEDGPIHPTDPPPGWLNAKGFRSPYSPWGAPPPSIVQSEEPPEPEEEFEASVFVSSVLGYTATTATLGAAKSVDYVNRLHQQVTDAVLAVGGTPVKYLGDGFLAYFDGDDAERCALRAAMAARAAVPEGLVVGIASGPIVRADVGHSEHARPDIIGDAVNAAYRVHDWAAKSTESHVAILGKVRKLDSEFLLRESDFIRLKGLPEPVTLFEVERALDPE